MNQLIDILQRKQTQPTISQQENQSSDFSDKIVNRSGLPLEIIAAVQKIYSAPQSEQGENKNGGSQMELNSGWGGKGR